MAIYHTPGVIHFEKVRFKMWPWWLKCFVPLSLGFRVLWQIFPNPLASAVFWTVSFVDEPFKWRYYTGWGRACTVLIWAGAGMNSIVTLANNGRMPVQDMGSAFSLWTPATGSTRLAWLGDNYAGFSLGDMVLGAGLLASILVCIATPITEDIQRRRGLLVE